MAQGIWPKATVWLENPAKCILSEKPVDDCLVYLSYFFLYLETSYACISIPLQVMNKYLTFEEDAPQKCIAFIIVYFSEFIKIEYVKL